MSGANTYDLFGEGTFGSVGAADEPKRDWTLNPPRSATEVSQMLREAGQMPLSNDPSAYVDNRTPEQKAQAAFQAGNFGATAGYAAGNQATRNAYDTAHRTTMPVGIGRLPGEIGKYLGGAQVNLNPFDGAPENVKDAAAHQAATEAYKNRFNVAADTGGPVPNIDVPTNPGAGGAPPGQLPGGTGGTGAPTDPTTPTGEGAPVLGRDAINEALGGIDAYQNALWQMSQDNTGLSAAEAQLNKATELANIQAGIATDASQRAALGQARSARNRGDRAFLEQQAIGEAGFIGQEAARTKALTDAEARGKSAELRAAEEDADRTFKFNAVAEAAKLGLNVAALELDMSKADLGSVTNQINQQFQMMGLEKQLDQRQAESMLNFTRDMAVLQQKYDQMDVDAQIETEKLLMQKYAVDQETYRALKDLQSKNDINWNQLAVQFISGAGKGATAAVFASDRRVKKNIRPVETEELEELLSALKGETYDYVDDKRFGGGREGRRFSFMAQDLEKTKLGKAMVKPFDETGVKGVDTGAVAMATAGGLALVYDRLKGLEAAVKS